MTEHKESMVTMYCKKGMRHGNNWIHHEVHEEHEVEVALLSYCITDRTIEIRAYKTSDPGHTFQRGSTQEWDSSVADLLRGLRDLRGETIPAVSFSTNWEKNHTLRGLPA